jgi:dienelactone hydrolase
MKLIQRPIAPSRDLRDMLRRHIVGRSLAYMRLAEARRESAIKSGGFKTYQEIIRESIRNFYGIMPTGQNAPGADVKRVSSFVQDGFKVENVLFDSYPGWQVNATVYVPTDFSAPFPAVVVPVGHSGKQYKNYQLPCQYFARCGFIAVCFDPPGQAGEKQPGNDHFIDGVRYYPLGLTSSRYFVADAIRCIDYLATRGDVDLSNGVAMTGVSGGGTTTTLAANLDKRITVSGPSCCVSPLAALDIVQGYAGCPETHMWRRYAEGVDEVDLLCAAAPLPCLLMAGEDDEVFHLDDTRTLATVAARVYSSLGKAANFEFFVAPGGHAYSLHQARAFVRFMRTHLCPGSIRSAGDIPDEAIKMLPCEELRSYPRTDVNMRTIAAMEAEKCSQAWDSSPEAIQDAAKNVAGINGSISAPEATVGEAFQVWVHDWRSVMLHPEPDIELPATLLTARSPGSAPAILHLDDCGRDRLLHHGPMPSAINFSHRERRTFNLLTVDLRGWGDSSPAMYPYEMASWGSTDRVLAYMSAALGDSVMAMRIRDALSALAWLRTRKEVDPDNIVLTGCGLGAMAALHAAVIDGKTAGLVIWEGLSSLRSLLAAERYPWPHDAFLPLALRHYDLPELTRSLSCPVHVHALRDGTGNLAGNHELEAYRISSNVCIEVQSDFETIASSLHEILNKD